MKRKKGINCLLRAPSRVGNGYSMRVDEERNSWNLLPTKTKARTVVGRREKSLLSGPGCALRLRRDKENGKGSKMIEGDEQRKNKKKHIQLFPYHQPKKSLFVFTAEKTLPPAGSHYSSARPGRSQRSSRRHHTGTRAVLTVGMGRPALTSARAVNQGYLRAELILTQRVRSR